MCDPSFFDYVGKSASFLLLGQILDGLLRKQTKSKIYDCLLELWVNLTDARIPDLPGKMAAVFTAGAKRVVGKKVISLRAFAVYFFLSILLTTLTVWLGDFGTFSSTMPFFSELSGFIALLVPNLLIDTLSIILTILLLKRFLTLGILRRILIVFLDILLATSFAILRFLSAMSLLTIRAGSSSDGWLRPLFSKEFMEFMAEGLRTLADDIVSIRGTFDFLYVVVPVIPSAIYLAILCFLMISKLTLAGGRLFGLYFTSQALDAESPRLGVFSLFGSVMSLITLACLLVAKLLR